MRHFHISLICTILVCLCAVFGISQGRQEDVLWQVVFYSFLIPLNIWFTIDARLLDLKEDAS